MPKKTITLEYKLTGSIRFHEDDFNSIEEYEANAAKVRADPKGMAIDLLLQSDVISDYFDPTEAVTTVSEELEED